MARKNPIAHLEGFKELNKALRAVGSRVGGLTLRKAAVAGAKVIVEEAQRLAPRDTGASAEGITEEPGRIQQGRAQINVGIGKEEWYGQLVELGTENMPAHPFLRPAFDSKKEEAIEAVENTIRDTLKDVMDE